MSLRLIRFKFQVEGFYSFIMCLKGPQSFTSSDSRESSSWQAPGKACVDYFSALAAWHSTTSRQTPGTWSSTRLPTRYYSTNPTSFLLPRIAWRRPPFWQMSQLARRWVARGLQQLGGCQRGGVRRHPEPEEPAGAEEEGPRCERRFLSRVHGIEWIQLSMNRRRAGRLAGIAPTASYTTSNVLYNSIYSIVI